VLWRLPLEATGSVVVFDVMGRRIATLAEGQLSAGEHTIEWTGAAQNGASAGAGLYFVRLAAGGTVRTARFVRIGGF